MTDYTLEELRAMKAVDIRQVRLEELVDIRDVFLPARQPVPKKIRSFLEQIKNPYCYRHGEYIVKIGFTSTDVTIEERLKEYVDRVTLAKTH